MLFQVNNSLEHRGMNENEMASPLAVGDEVEANDCAILQSILSDGHYNISAEDHSALASVIVPLYRSSVLEVSNSGDL